MTEWVTFRLSKGYFFNCHGSDESAQVGHFSTVKWVLFRLTKTPGLALQLRASLVPFPVHRQPLFPNRAPGAGPTRQHEREAGRTQAQAQRVCVDGDDVAFARALGAGAEVGGGFGLHGIIS